MNPKRRLLAPGPVPLFPEARAALGAPFPHHRRSGFRSTLAATRRLLANLLHTRGEVMILTASGTGGMEAAVASLASPGDRILSCECGTYGRRFTAIARALGMATERLTVPDGEAVEPDAVGHALRLRPGPRLLLVTAVETSTGVRNDLRGIAAAAREASPDTLLVVDAVCAAFAERLETDAWGLDCVIGASQKAAGAPPGLAFVALSPRAAEGLVRSRTPRYTLDLLRELRAQRTGVTAQTPAIPSVMALYASLGRIARIGLAGLRRETRTRALAFRASLPSLGMRPFPRGPAAFGVTVALLPEGVPAGAVVRRMEEQDGIVIECGREVLADRVLRVGHMGFQAPGDVLACVASLSCALRTHGTSVRQGAALAAARDVFRSARPVR